jgi:hypothetical protein
MRIISFCQKFFSGEILIISVFNIQTPSTSQGYCQTERSRSLLLVQITNKNPVGFFSLQFFTNFE